MPDCRRWGRVRDMRRLFPIPAALLCLVVLATPKTAPAQAPPGANKGFDAYVATVEARLSHQSTSPGSFLVPENESRLRGGVWVIEDLTPAHGGGLRGALLHHWRGTAFVAGASAADLERQMRSFEDYPRLYAPEVMATTILAHDDDRYRVQMRVRQRHGITVTLDTTYDVAFGRLDADHGFSRSHSTEIREAGSGQDHGFLWRQNTYWRWEERNGGLFLQVESVSLTRSIPLGLGWLVGPYLESIPRESLAFTLRATCQALQAETQAQVGREPTALQRRRP